MFCLQLNPAETASIAAAAANPASVIGGGLTLCGVKYMVLRADDTAIYCRKVRYAMTLKYSSRMHSRLPRLLWSPYPLLFKVWPTALESINVYHIICGVSFLCLQNSHLSRAVVTVPRTDFVCSTLRHGDSAPMH